MKKITFILVLIFITANLCGCAKLNKTGINQKIDTEISYLDGELILIANSINNIDYSNYKISVEEVQNKSSQSSNSKSGGNSDNGESNKEGSSSGGNEKSSEDSEEKIEKFSLTPNSIIGNEKEVNWKDLKKKIEILYSAWITISKDLKQAGISETAITEFENNIDVLAVSIKNEDANKTLESVVNLYKFLPEFANMNENNKKILNTKYSLLICYKNVNLEEWEQLPQSITDLKMTFSNISNQKTEYKGQEVNIESISTIINGLSNIAELKEKDIFFIKYKNILQELNIISGI